MPTMLRRSDLLCGQRTLVLGIGIDRIQGKDPILLTAQVVNFSAFGNGGGEAGTGAGGTAGMGAGVESSTKSSSVIIETSEGRSLSEAI